MKYPIKGSLVHSKCQIMIPITKPFLPPKVQYQKYINEIWERNWLTNHGPLVQELEKKLNTYLETSTFAYVSNGTIALQIAIKALELKGEIITTPFSYVATTSSIVWEGCHPVFVDIDSATFNIDPTKIEAAITEKTSAILATHIYGSPCDVEAIDAIAKKHDLKVIYDGAHAFGTKYKGKSIFEYGDISTVSFHATKLFHTIEGGGIFTTSEMLNKKIRRLRNFGHNSTHTFEEAGINGKNSEVHAAMGLCNFNYVEAILQKRKKQFELYRQQLQTTLLTYPKLLKGVTYNHAYYGALFPDESLLIKVRDRLEECNIFTRKYFFPSLDSLHYVSSPILPISNDITKRILCLPLYYTLTEEDIKRICKIINNNI